MRTRHLGITLVFLVGLGMSPISLATVVYTLQGENFTEIPSNDTPPEGTYTLSNSVTGFFQLDSPIPANLSGDDIAVLPGFAFSFSDGRQTITNLIAESGVLFELDTDAFGAITWYQFAFSRRDGINGGDIFLSGNTTSRLDIASLVVYRGSSTEDPVAGLDQAKFSDANYPATDAWLVTTVPEPAIVALFGLGLAGLGAVRRKKLTA